MELNRRSHLLCCLYSKALPASPHQLTVRTRPHITRYRRLTRTEAEYHPPTQVVDLFLNITTSSSSSSSSSSLFNLILSSITASISQRSERLRSPRPARSSHRVALSFHPPTKHVIATVAKQALNYPLPPTTTRNKNRRPAPFCRRPQPSTTPQQPHKHTADRPAQC